MSHQPERRDDVFKRKKFDRKKLTAAEAAAFNTLERFGWDIWFIRDEHNADKRVVVLHNSSCDHVGVLTDDEWNLDPDIELRTVPITGKLDKRTD